MVAMSTSSVARMALVVEYHVGSKVGYVVALWVTRVTRRQPEMKTALQRGISVSVCCSFSGAREKGKKERIEESAVLVRTYRDPTQSTQSRLSLVVIVELDFQSRTTGRKSTMMSNSMLIEAWLINVETNGSLYGEA